MIQGGCQETATPLSFIYEDTEKREIKAMYNKREGNKRLV